MARFTISTDAEMTWAGVIKGGLVVCHAARSEASRRFGSFAALRMTRGLHPLDGLHHVFRAQAGDDAGQMAGVFDLDIN